jgi:hypothetical protein
MKGFIVNSDSISFYFIFKFFEFFFNSIFLHFVNLELNFLICFMFFFLGYHGSKKYLSIKLVFDFTESNLI